MALKYQGDALFGVSLTVESPKPLDTRMVVDNTELLYSIPEQYAYEGMPVVNISNGNIYVLIDKNKISSKEGWKASYETIQIVTCTKAEYDQWLKNTNDKYLPVDDLLTWLHEDVYYYIYEDSIAGTQLEKNQYLSREWGTGIEQQLSGKASNENLTTLYNTVGDLANNINNNYITAEQISNIYATTDDISTALNDYYTKTETDRDFVKKSDLEGEFEGEGYAFVTQSQYTTDKQNFQLQLDQTIKVGENGTIDQLTVNEISSEDGSIIINMQTAQLNDKQIAVVDDIPKIVTLTDSAYQQLVDNNLVEENVYYYTYNEEDTDLVYVTKKQLNDSYFTKNYINSNFVTNAGLNTALSQYQLSGDYVVTSLLESYYTKIESDNKFYSKEESDSKYATQVQIQNILSDLNDNYITKSDLKGSTEDDDFIFVTKNEYDNYKTSQSQQIETNKLLIKDLEVTSVNNKLSVGNKIVAEEDQVPKLECLTESDYLLLVENDQIETDVYYLTYGESNIQDTGYVRSELLNERYYTKLQVNTLIQQTILDTLRNYNLISND